MHTQIHTSHKQILCTLTHVYIQKRTSANRSAHPNTHRVTVNAIKVSVLILSSKEFSEKSIGDTNTGCAG